MSFSGGTPRRSTASRSASSGPGSSGRTLYRAATRALAASTSAFAGWDVRRLQLSRRALGHHHAPPEDADALTALVERARLDGDDPPVGLRRRLALLEHRALRIDGVAMKRRMLVLERLHLEVGDRLAADVCNAHPDREAVHEISDHDVAPELGLRLRVVRVGVERVMVHREQAEEMVVRLGDRLAGPVPVRRADVELLEVAAELHVVQAAADVAADRSAASTRSIGA